MVTPGRVDVWTGDQSPDRALMRAADEAGVAPDQVFVHTLSWVADMAAVAAPTSCARLWLSPKL